MRADILQTRRLGSLASRSRSTVAAPQTCAAARCRHRRTHRAGVQKAGGHAVQLSVE